MPAIEITDSKGLVQVTGSGVTSTSEATFSGGLTIGDTGALKLSSATATSATIAIAHSTDYAVPGITQPAGTILKDVIFISNGAFVTAGNNGDDLDFEIGTAVSGAEIVALTALLDDGGAAVTWSANVPLYIIRDSQGLAANQFATTGVGPKGGPATTEAIVIAGPLYSAAARDLHVNFRPVATNLATAAATVKVIMTFLHV